MARTRLFMMDEEGVTAIEYALIAALIAMTIVAGVTFLGTSVGRTYDTIDTELNKAF